MARTKRKVNPLRPQPTAAPQAKEFQTAAYIRLSIEDSDIQYEGISTPAH